MSLGSSEVESYTKWSNKGKKNCNNRKETARQSSSFEKEAATKEPRNKVYYSRN